MVGATFEGIFYMHGMCFDMLTPIFYISVCRRIYGVIRGKGFAHVAMVNSMALDYSTAHIVHVRGLTERRASANINFPIFMVRVGRRFEGVPMRPYGDPGGGIVCKWSQAIVF